MTTRTIASVAIAVLLFAAGGTAGFLAAKRTQPDQSESVRKIAYWRAPVDPTEIYDAPGKSRMGMDLVPVYEDEVDGASLVGNGKSGDRKIAYWRAPMDPTETYDSPGKSRMGMDLIPVYQDELDGSADSGSTVTIDPTTVQNMGVRTAKVQREDFSRSIRTVGEVQYDEENLYQVNAKISGWLEKLYVNYVGEQVKKGDPLLEIYSPELVSTQEEYLLALNSAKRAESGSPRAREDAEQLLRSARLRLQNWDIDNDEIQRLDSTGEARKTLLLRAPASGIVVRKNTLEGAHVNAGEDLFQIADLRTVWVHASFYENELPWIREGQPVEMSLSYLPGRTYRGTVSYIYPYLREKARDVHVRLVFSNPDLNLKPGMYANVEVQGTAIRDAIVVPSEAVIRSGARSLVFVVRGPGKFEPREIQIGEEGGQNNAWLHVLKGVSPGEEVVVSAQFLLDSESRLQEAIRKMIGSDAGTARPEAMQMPEGAQPEAMQMPEGTQREASQMPEAQPEMNHDATDSESSHSGHGSGEMQ